MLITFFFSPRHSTSIYFFIFNPFFTVLTLRSVYFSRPLFLAPPFLIGSFYLLLSLLY
jgi:hypothetical protein